MPGVRSRVGRAPSFRSGVSRFDRDDRRPRCDDATGADADVTRPRPVSRARRVDPLCDATVARLLSRVVLRTPYSPPSPCAQSGPILWSGVTRGVMPPFARAHLARELKVRHAEGDAFEARPVAAREHALLRDERARVLQRERDGELRRAVSRCI